jgi:hypothetical protein
MSVAVQVGETVGWRLLGGTNSVNQRGLGSVRVEAANFRRSVEGRSL